MLLNRLLKTYDFALKGKESLTQLHLGELINVNVLLFPGLLVPLIEFLQRSFKQRLKHVEELLPEGALEIKADSVSVSKTAARADNKFRNIFQENQLVGIEVWAHLKAGCHRRLHLILPLQRELQGVKVLVEAHGVVLQLLENQSLKRLLVQVLLLDSACRQCVFEAAAEVFAGLTLMLLVVAQANPAEFVAALRTSHVHAALVLLDRILAPRTRFCVHLYPGFRIIVVALDTLVPLRQCVTVNRSVRWSQASEAKIFSALAKNVLLVLGRMADRFFALWVGTPLGVLAHVYV